MSDNNKLSHVIITGNYKPLEIASETVSIPAGAAGTVVDCYLQFHPIADSNHCYIGGDGNTSLVLTTATFTNEVAYNTPDASLSNGDYWVDYISGKLHGKKANTGISMTANYYVFQS